MKRSSRSVRNPLPILLAAISCSAGPIAAQDLPAPAYHDLRNTGHTQLASKLAKMLDLRAHPDSADVVDILARWDTEAGGPSSGYDHLAVARLWLRAGRAPEAELALRQADGQVPAGMLLLDQARVAFLAGDTELGARAYWRGCEVADQATSIDYWLDIESLATPQEDENWRRFSTLPPTERDLCGLLRRFWNERAEASLVTVELRLQQHYDRLRYAQANFLRRSGKKGPNFASEIGRPQNSIFDDRGLLYLRMGKPDRKTTYVNAECYEPNQSWAYYYPEETRVYHLSTLTGNDDWWLIDNLKDLYICGNTFGFGNKGPLSPANPQKVFIPGSIYQEQDVFKDLYASRGGLDPIYFGLASHMRPGNPNSFLEAFSQERTSTFRDAEFAIDSVPERPPVRAEARLMVEQLEFRGLRPDLARVWLNGVIEAEKLPHDTLSDGRYRYRVDAVYGLLGPNHDYQRGTHEFEAITASELGADESIPLRIPLDLAPGHYRYTLLVKSPRRPGIDTLAIGNYYRGTLDVHRFDSTVPQLSSVAVAPDSGGDWTAGGGVFLKPSPGHNTGADRVAHVYYEAYGLTAGTEYKTTVTMEPRGGGKPFTLEFKGTAPPDPAAPVRGYLQLDLRTTPPGHYQMSFKVTDETTGVSTLALPLDIVVDKE